MTTTEFNVGKINKFVAFAVEIRYYSSYQLPLCYDYFTGAGLLSRSRVTRVGSWNLCRDEAGDRGTIYEFPDIIWFMLNQTGANSGRREYTEQQGSGAGLQSALSSDILTRWSTVARSSYLAIRSKFTF